MGFCLCPLSESVVVHNSELKFFEYEHLPEALQKYSIPFYEVAKIVLNKINPGPQREVALQKLLEAKDAAVRAGLHPGG